LGEPFRRPKEGWEALVKKAALTDERRILQIKCTSMKKENQAIFKQHQNIHIMLY